MIQSSNSLAADDVCITCRLRRSPTSLDPTWDETCTVLCTMRQWKSLKKSKSCVVDGPEILLEIEMDPSMERWSSFSTTRSNSDKRKIWADLTRTPVGEQTESTTNTAIPKEPIRIPCSDIQLVEGRDEILFLTRTSGETYFEFTFSSRNAHDVLVAFLEASVPSERCIIIAQPPNSFIDPCGTAESFDVEMLTASRMRERVKGESWGEKTRRKVMHVVHRVTEISVAFSEKACAPCYDEKSPVKQELTENKRTFNFPDGLEESPEKQPAIDRCQIPSGMSMENSDLGLHLNVSS